MEVRAIWLVIAQIDLSVSPELLVAREEAASIAVSKIISPETAHKATKVDPDSVEREREREEAITATDATRLDIWPETAPTPKLREPAPKEDVEETASVVANWDISPETAQAVKCKLTDLVEDSDLETALSAVSPVILPVTAELKCIIRDEESNNNARFRRI